MRGDMNSDQGQPLFQVWDSAKHQASDPLEMPQLVSRIKTKAVREDTWVYLRHESRWTQAGQIAEMKMFFRSEVAHTLRRAEPETAQSETGEGMDIKLSSLRQISLLSELEDDQLLQFAQFMEIMVVPPFRKVVSKGEHGDAMYLILDGEVRASVVIEGKETTLAVIHTGKFFGELSILDQAPRASDVITNKESLLIKISADSFERLIKEHPDLALPFLYALSKSLAGRVRASSKQFQDSIHFARAASAR